MQNRRCVVLCNLKPAAMRGIKSFAMIFAATGADGSVELVEPPAGPKPGELLTVEGMPPPKPDATLNKKIWDKVVPDLKTDDSCVATFQGKKFMTSAGPAAVKSVKGAPIK
mmetsp:Transcript_21833/g.51974  ORF Transcript_21833/g.51974 Transcript_21833/m.51974 type:complete len:111 (-) Transcript_21833:24-356(-)